VAAIVTTKRRRNVLKDLVRVLKQEAYAYRDPITEFVLDLQVNFDFDAAQRKLQLCEQVLSNDFFLVSAREDFLENARLFIFETYCRIHQRIDIEMLAGKLGMGQEAAEKWIVNLIRNARLDAKIDSKNNHVIMGTQTPNVYQAIIEKTKAISVRSFVLGHNTYQYALAHGGAAAAAALGGRSQRRIGPQAQASQASSAPSVAVESTPTAQQEDMPVVTGEAGLADSLAAVTADD
jgi:translation initiation factor 3 subunit E